MFCNVICYICYLVLNTQLQLQALLQVFLIAFPFNTFLCNFVDFKKNASGIMVTEICEQPP
jgi:hypothetical protein